MTFDPSKPVSLEEYNASLRGTVNAYYEHAINDPTMTQEDAIKSTAAMSEQYLDAVQEFQEAQEMQTDANVMDTGSVGSEMPGDGIGDNGTVGGGIDNDGEGVDGGMEI